MGELALRLIVHCTLGVRFSKSVVVLPGFSLSGLPNSNISFEGWPDQSMLHHPQTYLCVNFTRMCVVYHLQSDPPHQMRTWHRVSECVTEWLPKRNPCMTNYTNPYIHALCTGSTINCHGNLGFIFCLYGRPTLRYHFSTWRSFLTAYTNPPKLNLVIYSPKIVSQPTYCFAFFILLQFFLNRNRCVRQNRLDQL